VFERNTGEGGRSERGRGLLQLTLVYLHHILKSQQSLVYFIGQVLV
jgi:hypothetical protein